MKKKSNIGIIVLALLAALVIGIALNQTQAGATQKYSEILNLFEEQKVTEFILDRNNGKMQLTIAGQEEKILYRVPFTELFINQVIDQIDEYNQAHPTAPMVYDFIAPSNSGMWLNIGLMVLSLVAIIGFGYFMMRQAGGGGKAMGVGKAKVSGPIDEKNKKTFADVAGADEEKEELEEIVEFLKNPMKFNALGARIPRGVLLVGPPGTGKTLLAKACAGEAGVPFYSISGSDFVEMYVGVGASRVRDLFEKAKKTAPSIVFIDEIDAVGRQRGAGLGGGHDEREQTLNQLLVEMDGFGVNEGVIVVAATNRADILDKALLRPGRFDRQVYVGYPDIKGREDILKVHTKNKPLAPDVSLKTLAKSTVGFTGADLSNLVNEAALLAAKKGRKAVVSEDVEEARNKVTMGPAKKSRIRTKEENRLTAYHEAGHAIAGFFCKSSDPVHQITIVPRGQAGGFTMFVPEKDKTYVSKTSMTEDMIVYMGGRVAEQLVLNEISTGASSDLQRATDVARSMVTRYGFSEKLGPVVYGQDPHETFLGRDFSSGKNYSENIAFEIDSEVREMLDSAYEACSKILSDNMDKLESLATVLLERETITGEEFKMVMEGKELPPMESLAQPEKLDVVVDENTAFAEPAQPSEENVQDENALPVVDDSLDNSQPSEENETDSKE